MFSHQELIQMPDIEIKESIPQQKCRTMINTGYMTTKEGSTHEVKIGEETVFHVSERGILHEENNKIWCEGQELRDQQQHPVRNPQNGPIPGDHSKGKFYH